MREAPDRTPAEIAVRLASAVLLAGVFIAYQPDAPFSLPNDVLLPLLGVAAAWGFTRSLLAISLTVLLLALAHTNLDAETLRHSRIFPVAALLAGAVLARELWLRFRQQVEATREAREAQRAERQEAGDD